MNVKFEYETLKRVIYWIVCKFKEDDFHQQNASSKRDLIGGFFDRWFKRAPEFLIFNELLKEKDYDVAIDNFLYGQNTNKNSPDVIGLKNKNGDIISIFAYFKDEKWVLVDGMPFIEVKTFRDTQSLITVPKSQLDDDKFYVFVESNVREDYLTALFEDSFFSEENFSSMKVSKDFIKSDVNNKIIKPQILKKEKELGYFKLIGIFKGYEVKKNCIKVGSIKVGTDVKPEKPRYFDFIEKVEKVTLKKAKGKKVKEELKEGLYYHLKENENNVPIRITKVGVNSKIYLKKELKLSIFVEVHGKVKINNESISNGYFRIYFKQFDRRSTKKEYVGDKRLFEGFANDVTNELITKFDKIVEKGSTRCSIG